MHEDLEKLTRHPRRSAAADEGETSIGMPTRVDGWIESLADPGSIPGVSTFDITTNIRKDFKCTK